MKTLAIRLEDDLHAQLSVLAQLDETTVTDAIRQAIEDYIEHKKSQPVLAARAEAVLADIERDASARRLAIASLFSENEPPEAGTTETARSEASGRSHREKGGEPATS